MLWPWVTRRTYDELMRLTERLQDDLHVAHECLSEAQRHAANSLAVIKEIARPVSPQEAEQRARGRPSLPPLPPAERDEIAEAIELAAGTDTALARHLARWAKKAKMDGSDDRNVINSILHWKPVDTWDGSDSDVPY